MARWMRGSSVFLSAAMFLAQPSGAQTNSVSLKSRLDRVLQINYRQESYNEEFELELDLMIARQKAGSQHEHVLSIPAYRKLQETHLRLETAQSDALDLYKQALSAQTDSSTAAAAAARSSTEEALTWFAGLGELDKLEVLDLYQDFMQSRGEAPLAETSSLQRVRSAFAPYIGLSSKQIEDKINQHRQELRLRAAAARAMHDPEFDRVDKHSGYVQPESPQPTAAGPVLYPSTGPNGNVDGHQLPEGTFVWTFDDGPHPTLTAKVLELLKNYHDSINKEATATFFRITDMVHMHPAALQLEKEAPYHMNNHTWTHPDFAKLAKTGQWMQLRHEVLDSTPELEKEFGTKFRFFRCPGGACVAPKIPQVRQMIADQGLIHAYWLIDTMDWSMKNQAQRVAQGAIKQMQIEKRGVILIHDIHPWSVEAAKMVFAWIKTNNDTPETARAAGGGRFPIRLIDLEDAVDEINKGS